MNKPSRKKLGTSISVIGTALLGQGLTYRLVQASSADRVADQVKVETIQLDFQQKTAVPPQQYSGAAAKTLGVQNQFIFLLVLTVLGLVGIFGLIKDFRQR